MNEFAPLGALIVGWLWQWARGPKHLPTWIANLVFVVVALAVYWFSTSDVKIPVDPAGIRQYVISAAMWVAATIGFGTAMADAKAAPRTNSLP